MAVEYDRHNAGGAANSYYERPATIALLGDVQASGFWRSAAVPGR